jgi:hypothetical protein
LASSVGSGPQLSAIIPHSSTDIHLGVCYHINDLGTGGHNLAYRKPHELELERQALYRSQFTNIINDAAREAKIVISFGYSLRIGEKRECFLHDTSFDLVEQPERLRSNAFSMDRRKLAEIFGPHLQAKPYIATKLRVIIETVDVMEYVIVSLVRGHPLSLRSASTPLLLLESVTGERHQYLHLAYTLHDVLFQFYLYHNIFALHSFTDECEHRLTPRWPTCREDMIKQSDREVRYHSRYVHYDHGC